MSDGDLLKIALILSGADGGCEGCCASLYRALMQHFPDVTLKRLRPAIESIPEYDRPYWADSKEELNDFMERLDR